MTISINCLEVEQAMDVAVPTGSVATIAGPAVAITTMGGFAVSVAGTVVDDTEWRRRQAAALVKILALAPRHSLHREQVMDALWTELSVDEAAPRLHKAAHYARRALGDPRSLVLAGESVALFPHQDVRVDALEFAALAEAALAERDPAAAAAAADAYRGEFLPTDRYERWAQDTRDRLHLLYLDVLRLAGRWDVLTAVDPTDEEAHLRVITALARRGERRAALRQFERLERALRQELGVAPSPAATRLRDQLVTAETTAAQQLSNSAGLRRPGPSSGHPPTTPARTSNNWVRRRRCRCWSAERAIGRGWPVCSTPWRPAAVRRCSSSARPVSGRPPYWPGWNMPRPSVACGWAAAWWRPLPGDCRSPRCSTPSPTCAAVTPPCSTGWTIRSVR